MTKPKHVYNTMARILTTIGFKNIDNFLSDPGDGPLEIPQQADPQEELIGAQMEIEQGKALVAKHKADQDAAVKQEAARLDHHAKMEELEIKRDQLDIDREKIAASMNETAAKIRSDEIKAAASLDAKAEVELMKANDADNDRRISMAEKQADRDSAERAAMAKAQKNIQVQRNADGSLSGTVG